MLPNFTYINVAVFHVTNKFINFRGFFFFFFKLHIVTSSIKGRGSIHSQWGSIAKQIQYVCKNIWTYTWAQVGAILLKPGEGGYIKVIQYKFP